VRETERENAHVNTLAKGRKRGKERDEKKRGKGRETPRG